jgi:hypothetical protein
MAQQDISPSKAREQWAVPFSLGTVWWLLKFSLHKHSGINSENYCLESVCLFVSRVPAIHRGSPVVPSFCVDVPSSHADMLLHC